MKIAIGCDHAAVDLKNKVIKHLQDNNHTVTDKGTYTSDSCDYPVYAKAVCDAVTDKSADIGILICGTGIGMSMAANKVKGIRAACCNEIFSAEMTRRHNDTNVLCMGARVIGEEVAYRIVDAFLSAEFEGGKHQRRVDMFMNFEI